MGPGLCSASWEDGRTESLLRRGATGRKVVWKVQICRSTEGLIWKPDGKGLGSREPEIPFRSLETRNPSPEACSVRLQGWPGRLGRKRRRSCPGPPLKEGRLTGRGDGQGWGYPSHQPSYSVRTYQGITGREGQPGCQWSGTWQMSAVLCVPSHCVLTAHWCYYFQFVDRETEDHESWGTHRRRVKTGLQNPGSSDSPLYLLGQLQTIVLITSEKPGPLGEAGSSLPGHKAS